MNIAIDMIDTLLKGIWPFARMAGMVMVMPVLGSDMLPARIKVFLVFSLCFFIVDKLPSFPMVDFSIGTYLLLIYQILIGVAIGFILQAIYQVFLMTGMLVGNQMGLGFAQMQDPENGVSVPELSQFFGMLFLLLFINFNGHLRVIQIGIESFDTIPVGFNPLNLTTIQDFAGWGAWIFARGLQLALPVTAALIIVNFGFGVLAKAAPQLNIFSIGFPIMLLCGFFLLWITLPNALLFFHEILELGFSKVNDMLKME
jgi:flagellar biosynthetic protein FliR